MECSGTLQEIRTPLGGVFQGDAHIRFTGVSTDTRSIKPGMLFVALNGENFDGSTFVAKAFEAGAVAAIATRLDETQTGIVLADTLFAYQALALWYREQLDASIIAITGSCAKTSVKELIGRIFEGQGISFKNHANFNNQVGVAKTLLDAPKNARYGVVEAGTNHPGEIEPLAKTIKAHLSIITNVGISHTEHFPHITDLIEEKMSLCTAMGTHGISLIPGDIQYAAEFKTYPRNTVITYGLDATTCDYYPEDVHFDAMGRVTFTLEGVVVSTQLYGVHAVRNSIAAMVAAHECGISFKKSAHALKGYEGFEKRFVVQEVAGQVLIDDTYNANVISTTAALETLSSIATKGRHIAVLGSMLELGDDSFEAHTAVLDCAQTQADMIFVIGKEYAEAGLKRDTLQLIVSTTPEEVTKQLNTYAQKGDTILFKGSRGMHMETILQAHTSALLLET